MKNLTELNRMISNLLYEGDSKTLEKKDASKNKKRLIMLNTAKVYIENGATAKGCKRQLKIVEDYLEKKVSQFSDYNHNTRLKASKQAQFNKEFDIPLRNKQIEMLNFILH